MAAPKVDVKVVILGMEFCGKTSLVERCLNDRFLGQNKYQVLSCSLKIAISVKNLRKQMPHQVMWVGDLKTIICDWLCRIFIVTSWVLIQESFYFYHFKRNNLPRTSLNLTAVHKIK
jgi:GTPase SAR1 family protein